MTSTSLVGSFRLRPTSRRVLEDAFGTGVMDELAAGDQPLRHGDFAPRTKAVRKVGGGRFGIGHGSGIVHEG
ncbi:MAG TPA: hypothetical protein VJR03_00930 [Nitrospira sp.]|nr:hypothetical protein [Nitrospira sp.]